MDRNEMNRALGMNEDELDVVAATFENGIWDASEYSKPRIGRPTTFEETMKPVTFKETPSVIAAIDERAKQLGSTRSDYLRDLIAKDLALA